MLQQELNKIWGGWKIDKVLGEGSFGKVYRIEREDFGHIYEAALKVITIPQNRSEVLTILNDGMDEESATLYFRSIVEDIVEEFVLMSKLKGNTNIVSYEDHAVIPFENQIGWNIYIRMELLTPLFDYLKTKSLSVRDVIRLGIDICSALEVCQKYNIIHRDIKPENIFVSDLGKFKLGDFGIARQLEKTSSGLSKKGTYSYMAPEVYKGEEYNSTVDIYSLGIVLYRFLNNNRTPFLPDYPAPIRYSDKEKANVMRMSGAQMQKPCNAEGRLAEIILKACAYNPKDRYESAVDMRKALESVLYDEAEANLAYPDGDKLGNEKFEYSMSLAKSTTGGKTPVENTEEKKVDLDETVTPIQQFSEEDNKEDSTLFLFGDRTEYKREQLEKERLEKERLEKEAKEKAEAERIKAEQQVRNTETAVKKKTTEAKEKKAKVQESESSKKGKMIGIAAAAVLVLGIGGFMAMQKSQEREVPNLLNKTVTEAAALTDVSIKEVGAEYSDTVEKGDILSQNIDAGTIVKKNDQIEVVVSKGSLIKAPKLIGLASADAEAACVNSELTYVVSEEQYSDSVEKGVVISQDPAETVEMEEGQTISVVVSKGVEKIEVPDVTGKSLKKAKKALEDAGFKVTSEEEYSSSVDDGKVISQSVKAGKSVKKGSKVNLVVSKGPKPKPTYTPPSTSAPKKSTKKSDNADSIDSWDLVN